MPTENSEKTDSFHAPALKQFDLSRINDLIRETRRERMIREIVEDASAIEARGFGRISFDNSRQRLKNERKIIEGADPESTNILGIVANLLLRKVLEIDDLKKFFENGKANGCIVLKKTERKNSYFVRISPKPAIKFLKKTGAPLPSFIGLKSTKKELAN